ncbi:beta-1,3-galactosyltransferase 1-like [Liolophura sinensis]|uniref:beta-1,3-galactosyltransferase 1-like n=1 Tax=Liolophura sinensis TaxID=3198878 RepID=UPI0031594EAB
MARFKPKTLLALGVMCCAVIYLSLGVVNHYLHFTDIVDHQAKQLKILSSIENITKQIAVRNVTSKAVSTMGKSSLFTSKYLLNNPFMCSSEKNLTFIVIIHTAIENFNKRLGIRQTWANPVHYKTFTMRTVFFVGRPKDKALQSFLQSESEQHNDLVQGNFLDTYRNITYKAVMAFQWIYEFCSHAQIVLKADDDMFVNMFKLVQWRLPVLRRQPRQMMCEVVRKGRIRRKKGDKWAILPGELSGRTAYPTYCRGYLVLITPDLIKLVLNKVSSTPFFWIDDVYLYGLVPEFLNITWRNIVPLVPESTENCWQAYSDGKNRPYLFPDGCLNIPSSEHMVNVWLTVLINLPGSSRHLLTEHTLPSWLFKPFSNTGPL